MTTNKGEADMGTRHYGRGDDGLSVRSIDLPDGRTGWVIDNAAVDYLDTRHPFATRRAALESLEDLRHWAQVK